MLNGGGSEGGANDGGGIEFNAGLCAIGNGENWSICFGWFLKMRYTKSRDNLEKFSDERQTPFLMARFVIDDEYFKYLSLCLFVCVIKVAFGI